MSRSYLLALLLGALLLAGSLSPARADEYDDDETETDGDVVVVGEDNWDTTVKTAKFALVEFYAPWCGHCKKLEPEYTAAATKLKAYDPTIMLAKVDATEHGALASKFGVKGYPTIKWFIDGEEASDYNGGRDTDGIVTWIKKKTGPFAETIDSADKLAELEKENDVMIVGYFDKFEGDAFDTYKSVGTKIEDVALFQTSDAAVAKAIGLTKAGTFAAIKQEDVRVVALMEPAVDADSLKLFINAEKMPLTIEFTSGNANKIFKSGIDKQIIFWAKAAEFKDGAAFKTLKSVAKEFKGQLVFVTSNAESSDAEPITKFFGLAGQDGPVAMGFHLEKNSKYRFAGEFTVAALTEFASSLVDGTAEPDYKSADIPEEPLDEGVTVVVGKSFKDIVLDPKKDVMLEVYAPWCGHCKSLAPIYSKLAAKFAGVESVVIAKMDGTENEHAMVEAKGFPTILFYPAGDDKTPVPYSGGDRSLEALAQFIVDKSVSEFELGDEGTSEADDEDDGKDEL